VNYFKQKIIVTAVVAIIFLAVLILVIIPTLKDISNLKHKILLQKAELEERYNRRVSTKLTLQSLKEIKSEFGDVYGRIFTSSGQELDFITLLEDLTAKHNLEQRLRLEVNLKTNLPKSREVEIPLFLDLTGNYLNLISYLGSLEKARVLVIPESLEIRNAGRDSGKDMINARLQLRTFWQ